MQWVLSNLNTMSSFNKKGLSIWCIAVIVPAFSNQISTFPVKAMSHVCPHENWKKSNCSHNNWIYANWLIKHVHYNLKYLARKYFKIAMCHYGCVCVCVCPHDTCKLPLPTVNQSKSTTMTAEMCIISSVTASLENQDWFTLFVLDSFPCHLFSHLSP